MTWFTKLANVFRLGKLDRELDEEMRFHLDMRAVEYEQAGLSREDARRKALKRFGSPLLARERVRDVAPAHVARQRATGHLARPAAAPAVAGAYCRRRPLARIGDWRHQRCLHRRRCPHAPAAAGCRTEGAPRPAVAVHRVAEDWHLGLERQRKQKLVVLLSDVRAVRPDAGPGCRRLPGLEWSDHARQGRGGYGRRLPGDRRVLQRARPEAGRRPPARTPGQPALGCSCHRHQPPLLDEDLRRRRGGDRQA